MRTRLMNTRSWLHRRRLLLDGGEPAPTDPYWANVSVLYDMAGVDAGTETFDLTANDNDPSFEANAVLTDTEVKFGDLSLDVDGDADFLSIPNAVELQMAAEPFTIEGHMFLDVVDASGQTLAAKWINSGTREWVFGRRTSGNLEFVYSTNGTDNATVATSETWTPTVSTWYHVAVSRGDDDVIRLFVDGVQLGTGEVATFTIASNGGSIYVGAFANVGVPAEELDGKIANFRITKGVGRYTENFTPPSAAYPTS